MRGRRGVVCVEVWWTKGKGDIGSGGFSLTLDLE